MQNTRIGWSTHTWNPWIGCEKHSTGCKHCYIDRVLKRMGKKPFGEVVRCTSTWASPPRWDRAAAGRPDLTYVFTCSLSDFFHEKADPWRDEAWEVIRSCRNLTWLVLTKRAGHIASRLPADWGDGYENVWLGVTVESQDQIEWVDVLADTPAAVRFVSAEPLIGPVVFGSRLAGVDWVITGCENAHRDERRPMDDAWVRSIRDECDAGGVALFHKQYYVGSQLTYDGLIDGVVRQDWPATAVA